MTGQIINNNDLIIQYPKEFVSSIKHAFGENSKPHKLVLLGSYRIGEILNDLTDEYISHQELVDSIEGESIMLHNVYNKCRELNIYDNLWFEWNDIIENALDNLEINDNQIKLLENIFE